MRPALTLDLPGLTLLRPVGSGSFGEVWLARTVTGQFRAVKIVWLRRPGEAGAEASLQELGDRVFRGVQEYVRRIPPGSSAGLAVLHVDRDPDGRFFYYVMELADDAATGRDIDPERYEPLTLGELRRRAPGGAVSADETIRLGVKLAEGLAALHHAGLVHRDIKPSNIVFIGGEPRLADIDLVRPHEASLSLGGTLGYAPPESPGRPPADVFSLGRTLYVTVTGLSAGEFPRLPDDWDRLPGADGLQRLNSVLLRACDRDPAKRHQDGAALRDDLLLVAAGEDPERWRWLKQSARTATIVAGIAVPVAIAALLVAWELRQKEAAKTVALNRAKLAEAAKAFALYQANLSEAASNLERLNLSSARRALAGAAASPHRGLELDLLGGQAEGDLCSLLPSLGSLVDQLFFSDDGKWLAVATGDYRAHVFSLPTGRPAAVLTNVVRLAGFLGSGRSLVGMSGHLGDGYQGRALQVWDLPSGKPSSARLPGRWVTASVLPDGETIAAVPRAEVGHLMRWQPSTDAPAVTEAWHPHLTLAGLPMAEVDAAGRRIFYRQNTGREDGYVSQLYFGELGRGAPEATVLPQRNVKVIALSSDGQRAAYAEPSAGELVTGVFADGFRAVATNLLPEMKALAFTADGGRLASGGSERLVRLHDGLTLATQRVLAGHSGAVTALAWSRDGTWLASGDHDGEVRVWRPSTTREMREDNEGVWSGFKTGVGPVQMVASDDEALVAATAGTNSLVVLDARTLRERQRISGPAIPLRFTSGSDQLWALAPGGRLVRTRLADGVVVSQMNAFDDLVDAAFGQASPDGRRLVLYSGREVTTWALDQDPPRRLPLTARHTQNILDLAISPDSRYAVTVAFDDPPHLLDIETGKSVPIYGLTTANGQPQELLSACFVQGPVGKSWCVLGTKTGQLLRVDMDDLARHETLPSDLASNFQIVATPDGERLFAAGSGGRLGVGRGSDGTPLVWFTHRGLAARPGEHALKRLLYLPRQRRLLSLTEDGLLARW